MTRAVSDAYRLGRVDGLREAVTILQEMGGAIDAKRPSLERRTRDSRRMRRQAYRNAEVRLTTALKRRGRNVRDAESDLSPGAFL